MLLMRADEVRMRYICQWSHKFGGTGSRWR
jgi:hypothetical protein